MKILLLLLVFLLCKEGKSSVSEQSAGSGDFSDIEEDENNTETQSITSDDEYDVYYVNRLFFLPSPPPLPTLKLLFQLSKQFLEGKCLFYQTWTSRPVNLFFSQGNVYIFFTIIFQYFSYGQRINAAAASTRSKKGVKWSSCYLSSFNSTIPLQRNTTNYLLIHTHLFVVSYTLVNCW